MKNLSKLGTAALFALTAGVAGGLTIAPANACGLIGCIVNSVVPGAGDQLDDAHARMGRPLDHLANQAAGAAADYVAPGSGPAVTQGLEMYDRMRRNGGVSQGGGFQQVRGPIFGNFCQTPAGRFGPGPMNPVGSSCNVPGPWGLMFGSVTQ